jgi:uncharacterized protein YgiB involved in biofilm formation
MMQSFCEGTLAGARNENAPTKESAMRYALRRLVLGLVGTLALFVFSGCAEHEHRKVQVIEEQHEGEVVEEDRGHEMIVE